MSPNVLLTPATATAMPASAVAWGPGREARRGWCSAAMLDIEHFPETQIGVGDDERAGGQRSTIYSTDWAAIEGSAYERTQLYLAEGSVWVRCAATNSEVANSLKARIAAGSQPPRSPRS